MPTAPTTNPRSLLLLCATAAVAACGDARSADDTARASLEGTLGGVTFAPQDAAFVYSSGDNAEILVLVLTDLPDACAAITDGRIDPEVFEVPLRAPDAHLLAWSVTGRLGDAGPDLIGPATIPAFFGDHGPTGALNAYPLLRASDAQCQSEGIPGEPGASGELVIEALSTGPGGRLRGHFEVRQPGETLRGDFEAAPCDPAGLPPAPPCP